MSIEGNIFVGIEANYPAKKNKTYYKKQIEKIYDSLSEIKHSSNIKINISAINSQVHTILSQPLNSFSKEELLNSMKLSNLEEYFEEPASEDKYCRYEFRDDFYLQNILDEKNKVKTKIILLVNSASTCPMMTKTCLDQLEALRTKCFAYHLPSKNKNHILTFDFVWEKRGIWGKVKDLQSHIQTFIKKRR